MIYNKKEAEGVEKSMLDKFNSISIEQLSSIVKLNAKQKDNLQKHMPYNRFWKISETESIGIKTYSMIFKYFYGLVLENREEYSQVSLFEF